MQGVRAVEPIGVEDLRPSPIATLNPPDPSDGDYFYPKVGYEELLADVADVEYSEDFGSYQGDSVFLLRHVPTGQYGFTVVGYGSCSGCDAMQACSSLSDLEALRDQMLAGIHWGLPGDLAARITARGLDWWCYDDDAQRAIGALVARLRAMADAHGEGVAPRSSLPEQLLGQRRIDA